MDSPTQSDENSEGSGPGHSEGPTEATSSPAGPLSPVLSRTLELKDILLTN